MILLVRWEVPLGLLQVLVVNHVQADVKLLQPIDHLVLEVAKLRHFLRGVRELAVPGVQAELLHRVIIGSQPLVNDFAPVEGDLGEVGVVPLQCYLEHCPDEPCHILGHISHV